MSRRAMLLCSVVLMALGAATWSGCGPSSGDPLWFDATGTAHGSGTQQYFYPDNRLKLEDVYRDSELQVSRWFRPDGSMIAETTWDDGSGVGYYLWDDGSVRMRMTYRGGVAHGPAERYHEDGTLAENVIFENGRETRPAD